MTGLHRFGLIEIRIRPPKTSITALECPSCCGPVFAPADSDGETITCTDCAAELVTARVSGGVVALLAGVLP